MITYLLLSLFALSALAATLSLADSALRWKYAFASLKRERALAKAGFVPQVTAREVRLRGPVGGFRGDATRPFAQRTPRRAMTRLGAAAA